MKVKREVSVVHWAGCQYQSQSPSKVILLILVEGLRILLPISLNKIVRSTFLARKQLSPSVGELLSENKGLKNLFSIFSKQNQ